MERNYTMLRRVFDEVYYAVEEMAGKFPNEVIVPFKVERINEVLRELRGAFCKESHAHRGRCAVSRTARDIAQSPSADVSTKPLSDDMSSNDPIYKHLRLIEEGLTYSDVLLILKWYKVLPR